MKEKIDCSSSVKSSEWSCLSFLETPRIESQMLQARGRNSITRSKGIPSDCKQHGMLAIRQ